MAITATHITTDIDDGNLTIYTTASGSPTANRLQIIDIVLADSNPVLAPTVTGCGLTWVSMGGVEYDTAGTRHAIYRFRALGASPTTGALTITATEPMAGCGWSWAEYDGIDTSGTNGSGAIVQTITNSGSGTTLSGTLAAFGSSSNGVSVGLSTDGDSVFTAGSGYTILGQDVSASASPTESIAQEWRADNDTTPDATITVSALWGLIASELKAAAAAAAVGFPAVAVSLGLGSGPLTASPTWTAIPTGDFVSLRYTSSGRELDIEDFVGGSGSLVLNNNDGRYTPGNSSSPYYPYIRLRVPVRIVATRGTDTLTIRAVADATPTRLEPPNASTCEWPLADVFTLMNEQDGEYPWLMAIRQAQPRLWFNYNELSGTTAIDDSGNGYHGTYTGSPTLQVSFGTGTGATFNGTSQSANFPATAAISGTGDFAVEAYFDATVTGTDQIVYGQFDPTLGAVLHCWVLSTGVAHLSTKDASGTTTVTGVTNVASNPETHVVWRRQGTTHEILVNGVVDATATGTARNITAAAGSAPDVSFAGTIDALATYQGTITQATAIAHFNALLGYHALSSGTQVGYILDAFGFPSSMRSIDTGNSLVLGQFDPQGSVLDMLRLAANSEMGALYVKLDGTIRFRQRQAIMLPPYTTSQGTFGNGASAVPVVSEPLTLANDPTRVRNDVTLSVNWQTGPIVTTPYTVSVRKTDRTSTDNYGTRSWSPSGGMYTMVAGGTGETAVLLNGLAEYVIARYKDPQQELRELVLHPVEESATSLWTHVLTRSQEDRITHTHTASWGQVITSDYHIQKITHEIGPGKTWRTKWVLSPADTQSYWIWDTSTWDTSTRWGV